MRSLDDDGERRVYIGSKGGGAWWLQQNEISIAFPEIEQERGLIEFWLELVLSIVDAMRWGLSPCSLDPSSGSLCVHLVY